MQRSTPPTTGTDRTSFADAVYAVVASTRPGEVLTYGEVALEAGSPGAARAVGRVLATGDGQLPWWRIVTADGRLAPGKEARQAALLGAEGVMCDRGRVLSAHRKRLGER